MRVEQEEGGYKAITIILETKKEAKLMAYILNCAPAKSLENYAEEQDIDADELKDFHYTAWEELDKYFKDY